MQLVHLFCTPSIRMMHLMRVLFICTLTSFLRSSYSQISYCPYGWEEFGGNCLFITEMIGKPNEARTYCQRQGGSLAIIENRKQHNYLQGKMALGNMASTPLGCTNGNQVNFTNGATWTCIGQSNYENWYWYDDTSNAGFWNWESGEPSNEAGEISRAFLHLATNWTDDATNDTMDMMVACLHGKLHTQVICPIGWTPYDNKCIYWRPDFIGRPKQVRTFCEDQGGSMLTIDNFAENSYRADQLQASGNDQLVLGCNDQGQEGYWHCDDRVDPYMVHWSINGTEAGYWNWGQDQPDDTNPDADCAFLRTSAHWRALPCNVDYEMVLACEQGPSEVLCPTNFKPWEDRCLYLTHFNGTATEALEECKSFGGNLVTLDNEKQNEFLQYEMNSRVNVMAMGCTDDTEEGLWTCYNKDPSEVFYRKDTGVSSGYWNWNTKGKEPDDTDNQDCLYMYHKTGTWRSESCHTRFEMLLACYTFPFFTAESKDESTDQYYSFDIRSDEQPIFIWESANGDGKSLSAGLYTAVIFCVVGLIAALAGIVVMIRKRKQASEPQLIE